MQSQFGFEAPAFEIDPEWEGEAFEWGRRAAPARRSGGSFRPPPRPGRPRPYPKVRRFGSRPGLSSRPRVIFPEPFPVEPDAQAGMSGSERVRWLQDCLNQALGLQLPVTGVIGPQTRSAVRTFQQQKGLRVSGIAGPDTEDALKSACSEKSSAPVDKGGGQEDSELGPLTATLIWLSSKSPADPQDRHLFTVEQARRMQGGGIYILVGRAKSKAKSMQKYAGGRQLLKVGKTESFANRFRIGGDYDNADFRKSWTDVHAYLARVRDFQFQETQVERAIARLFYRAGEDLPLDRKPFAPVSLTGPVRVESILPPALRARLQLAYRATTGSRVVPAAGASEGKTVAVPAGTGTGNVPGDPNLLYLDKGTFPRWEIGTTAVLGDLNRNAPDGHRRGCRCPRCRMPGEAAFGESEFPVFGETFAESAFSSPFSEAEELTLAAELLSVTSEEDLDQFLGKLVRGAWRGIKKVGKLVGKIAKPLGGVLKTIAKKALPFVGGALGSFIPIPGVGTAVGSALGGALSKALETEFGESSQEEQEFEMARRFVRLAGTAARQAALAPPDADEGEVLETALMGAARRHLPNFPAGFGSAVGFGGRARSGRWVRREDSILVLGA